MYIKKYWGNFIGGSDDSLNLVAFLEDQKKEEIPLSEIFAKIGLDKQNWDFRQTVEYLEFTHSDGVEMDFHFAIDVVTDLAAILLECSVSGSVNLQDLDEYNTPARRIRITATPEEHDAMNKSLADFAQNPLEYDLSEMMDNEEIQEMARDVEALRKELYEAAGRNRDYHVKAEDVARIRIPILAARKVPASYFAAMVFDKSSTLSKTGIAESTSSSILISSQYPIAL